MTDLTQDSATRGETEEGLCHEGEICPSVITCDEFYHPGHAGAGGRPRRLTGIAMSGRAAGNKQTGLRKKAGRKQARL